jgi:hypothetical protein
MIAACRIDAARLEDLRSRLHALHGVANLQGCRRWKLKNEWGWSHRKSDFAVLIR